MKFKIFLVGLIRKFSFWMVQAAQYFLKSVYKISNIFVSKLDVDMTVSILLLCSVAISKTAIAFLEGKISANIPGAMLFIYLNIS